MLYSIMTIVLYLLMLLLLPQPGGEEGGIAREVEPIEAVQCSETTNAKSVTVAGTFLYHKK